MTRLDLTANKIKRLALEVLEKYPELKDYQISVVYRSLPDAYGQCLKTGTWSYLVEISNSLRSKKEPIKVAALASEFSHIARDSEHSTIGGMKDIILYNISKRYRKRDEMETDLETVARGFSKELLELLEYEESRGEDKKREKHEGLTVEELKQLIKKLHAQKDLQKN